MINLLIPLTNTTGTPSGSSVISNSVSVVSTRSTKPSSGSGMLGLEPVAMTAERKRSRVCASTSNVRASTNTALPATRLSAGSVSRPSSTDPTKRSRKARTRSITARPSTRTCSAWTPNRPASRAS